MLKKENRLSGNKQIKEVFDKGKMRQSPLFGVLFIKDEISAPSASSGQVKFGIVVSKKISKKAVERNRIRRKIYKEVGEILGKIKGGLRVVFLVKKAILEASDEEIEKEVKRSLENI
jgi:ribonuclease P protein component